MRAAAVAAVLAVLMIFGAQARADTGWARYDRNTWVRWSTRIDHPSVGQNLDRRFPPAAARFRAERARAIRAAVAAHKRWLVSQAHNAAIVAQEPSGGHSEHVWGAGAVQVLIRAYFPSGEEARALCTAWRESHFDPYARNKHSSASGVFQFVSRTWAYVSRAAGWGGASVFSARANVAVAAWVVAHIGWSPWGGGCI